MSATGCQTRTFLPDCGMSVLNGHRAATAACLFRAKRHMARDAHQLSRDAPTYDIGY